MEEKKTPRKPVIYYYASVLITMIILNSLFIPLITKKPIVNVDYGTFIMKADSGLIKSVSVHDDQILFTLQEKTDKGESNSTMQADKLFSMLKGKHKETVYSTVPMDDPSLVDRLMKASSPNENGKIAFTKVLPRKNSPLLSFLLTWILPFVIFYGIGEVFTKKIQQSGMGGGNFLTLGKSNAKIYVQAETGKAFSDVAGQEEAKEALAEVIDFLHNPSKYAEIGASLPKGALLVGPPGTGKTLLAKAVAGEAKVPFFSITGSEFVEMFVGMGAAKVRDLFKQASEKAPCIIFIDEIDTIGKKRDSGFAGGNDEREQTLNQLLAEMDGFEGTKGIVILAATNRPEILDKALLRPGRFDRRIPVELPDLKGREAILKVHSKNKKLSGNIDFNILARSAPDAPAVALATTLKSISLLSFLFFECTFNMASRPFRSGSSTGILRSKRPGRSSALSNISGLFVAARITIPFVPSNPSISDKKLVQCLFSFIISAHNTAVTFFTNGINFINKNNAGCFFTGLFKKVPDLSRSHSHKHFYKF